MRLTENDRSGGEVSQDSPPTRKQLENANPKWQLAQFLERHWWRRYLRSRPADGYLANKKAYWERTLGELKHLPTKGYSCLDAGCGPAGVFILLEAQEQVTALDPLLVAYEKDLEIFKRANYPGVSFVVSSLEAAPATLGPFDTIYCFNAINHVADWKKAFTRLTDWAKPGTHLLMSSDVHRRHWLRRLFRALPGDLLHPQQHGREDYRKRLENNGWRIEREVLLRRTLIFDYVGWVAVYNGE